MAFQTTPHNSGTTRPNSARIAWRRMTASGILSSCCSWTIAPRVSDEKSLPYFTPRFQLPAHFPSDASREACVFRAKKRLHGFSIPLRQLAERPRQGFHHHVVTVVDEQATHSERPPRVACTASSFRIEWNRRN